jgi:hypothetical protein
MARNSIAFTSISSTESAGTILINTAKGNRQAGKVGYIRDVHLRQISGDGTQWRFRFYQGTTASPRDTFLTYVDLPSVDDTFDNADDDEATSVPDSPKEFATRYLDYGAGWTDEDTPIAGLGIYVSADQINNNGATNDAVTLTVTTTRRG